MSKVMKHLKKAPIITSDNEPKKAQSSTGIDFNLDRIIGDLPQPMFGQDTRNWSTNREEVRGSGQVAKSNTVKVTGIQPTELSKDYVEINKNDIQSLPTNTYIRYIDKTGTIKPGGKLKKITIEPDETKIMVGKYNIASKKYFMWTIKLSDIKKLYKFVPSSSGEPRPAKQSIPSATPVGAPADNDVEGGHDPGEPEPSAEPTSIEQKLGDKLLFNDSDILRQKILVLETDVAKVMTEQQKMLTVLRRLHDAVMELKSR